MPSTAMARIRRNVIKAHRVICHPKSLKYVVLKVPSRCRVIVAAGYIDGSDVAVNIPDDNAFGICQLLSGRGIGYGYRNRSVGIAPIGLLAAAESMGYGMTSAHQMLRPTSFPARMAKAML